MDTKLLKLEDRQKIEYIRKKYNHDTSSHAFASLYIWKDDMKLSLYLKDEMFAVKSDLYGENTWFFPCGCKEDICDFLKEVMKIPNLTLLYIRNEDKIFLEEYFPEIFSFVERPDSHEYMYDRIKQQDLQGRKYSKLRNHINRVTKDHDLSYSNLNKENLDLAIDIISKWDNTSQENTTLFMTDKNASKTLLLNANKLDVSGILIYVEDIPYAVVAGFPLSKDTFDICVAKQKNNLSGLSVYAKNRFIKSIPNQYKYINAEEDLGIEGLRTMKNQMKPIGQVKMFEGRAFSDSK